MRQNLNQFAPLRPRLIAGLLYLQHTFDLPDDGVVWGGAENPYWQVVTGETYLQTEPPIDRSSLSRWRRRLGEAGVEELLAQSIEAAKRASVINPASIKRVIVDTTVMTKAIAPPTDSALLEKSRVLLVKAARHYGPSLRRNYNRLAPRLVRSGRALRPCPPVQTYAPCLAGVALTRGTRAA